MNLDQLKRYSASKKIPLGITEKDYVLSVVLMQLSRSNYANRLLFKGGTAIKKVYFHDTRFSEDLDFNFYDVSGNILSEEINRLFSGKTLLEINFKNIKSNEIQDDKALIRLKYEAFLGKLDNVRLDFTSKEPILTAPGEWTLKDDYDISRRMTCEHLLTNTSQDITGQLIRFYGCNLGRMPTGRIDSLKACVDCKMQAPRRNKLLPMTFKTMSLEEILSEKVRACLTRGKPRDLYDIWFLQLQGIKLDHQLIIDKLQARYKEYNDYIPNIQEVIEKIKLIEPEWDRDLQNLVPFKSYPNFQDTLENIRRDLKNCGWKE